MLFKRKKIKNGKILFALKNFWSVLIVKPPGIGSLLQQNGRKFSETDRKRGKNSIGFTLAHKLVYL